jgi:uncharacterized membrane protein required for colicin V production
MTLCGLLITILAFTGAKFTADRLSPKVAYIIEPAVENIVQTEFHNALPDQAKELEQFPWDSLDKDFWGRIVNSDFYQQKLDEFMQTARDEINTIMNGAAALIAASLAQSISWILTYLLAFAVITIVGNLLVKLLDLAAKLPGLRTLNRSLGGLCGLVKGAIILAVICSIGAGFGIIPQESIQQSALLGVFTALSTISQ